MCFAWRSRARLLAAAIGALILAARPAPRLADRRPVRGRFLVQQPHHGRPGGHLLEPGRPGPDAGLPGDGRRHGAAGRPSPSTARPSIPRTGRRAAGWPLARPPAHDFRQPFQWPPGPGSYVAAGVRQRPVHAGFATYMPYLQQIHFPLSVAGDEPTRYQMLSMDLRNLALVPALAIRFGNDLRIGLAPGFLFSTGTLDFAEDTALDGGTAGADAALPRHRRAAPRTRPPPPAITSTPARGWAGRASRSRWAAASTGAGATSSSASRTRAGRWARTSTASRSPASQSSVTLPPRLGGGPADLPRRPIEPLRVRRSPATGCPTW